MQYKIRSSEDRMGCSIGYDKDSYYFADSTAGKISVFKKNSFLAIKRPFSSFVFVNKPKKGTFCL